MASNAILEGLDQGTNGSDSERYSGVINGEEPSQEIVQGERNETSIQETRLFHASACHHVASVEPVEEPNLESKGSDQPSNAAGFEQCLGIANGVKPSDSDRCNDNIKAGEPSQKILQGERNVSSTEETSRFYASACHHVASVEPVKQPIMDSKDSYVPVTIPELDPEDDFRKLPSWMRYDPTNKVNVERYICIFCKCVVPRCDSEEHATGKKHTKMSSKFASRSLASFNSLATLLNSYKRELRLFSSDNRTRMAESLQSLITSEDQAISVGFVIDYGHLACLSLVTKNVCLNIDRTILSQADIIREMVVFREIFESSCTVGGGNMWELMMVLYHSYGIICNAVADMDEFATEDAGEELSLSNPKVHHEAATKALECYDSVNACKTNLLGFKSICRPMLKHICLLNMQMYNIYAEIRKTILEVKWSNGSLVKNGAAFKLTCDEYKTRIRQNSLVRLEFANHVIYGQCLKWDCARTGNVVEVVLDNLAAGGLVKKIFVNRKKEKMMRRVLLRTYILRLASAAFRSNCYQDHLYGIKPFFMRTKHEQEFKKKMQQSRRLNIRQNYCLLRSMFPISIIHGPPGTGKTRALSVICQDAVKRGQGVICICWTNVAVRRLCEAIVDVLQADVARIVTSLEYKCWHEAECRSLKEFEAKSYECQVLCMTISNYLYRLQTGDSVNKWGRNLSKQREVLLADEVSQLWEMEGAMSANYMGRYKRVVACGDGKQLRPHVLKHVDDSPSLLTWIESLRGTFKVPCTHLVVQYRMMPSVGTVVSKNFYEGTLLHHKAADNKKHLFFHSVQGSMGTKSTSRFCAEDSKKCIAIIKHYPKSLKIQVLTFYEAQCSHLKSLDSNINVCCIDSYQGQEADIVILLLSVRKCKLSHFMLNMGRLCVATSRAKINLHIVGDLNTMLQSDIWQNILGSFTKRK